MQKNAKHAHNSQTNAKHTGSPPPRFVSFCFLFVSASSRTPVMWWVGGRGRFRSHTDAMSSPFKRTSLGCVFLGTFAWKLPLGSFSVNSSLGSFCLEILGWDLRLGECSFWGREIRRRRWVGRYSCHCPKLNKGALGLRSSTIAIHQKHSSHRASRNASSVSRRSGLSKLDSRSWIPGL